MNEKFKQLALEAKMGTADFDAGSYYVATPDRMQLFAESIVQDCYQKLIDMDQQVKATHNYYKHAAIQIKLHFGLEP